MSLNQKKLHMDAGFMERAVSLAEKGRLSAPPNPWVGCVIVRNGKIVGEGYHIRSGGPHAERHALNAAGSNAEGATAYVTLEPCSHHGKTPPCVEALIEAKIGRVVVALEDPDPRVKGRGFALLKDCGIPVDLGVCKESAATSLKAYLHHRKTRRPYCVLKSASSFDGRTAAADGSSQWITMESARIDVHQLRASSQAIMVGSGTAINDSPSLTARHKVSAEHSQPLRVLLDSTGRVPAKGPLFDIKLAKTLVMTTAKAPEERLLEWKKSGCEVEILPASPDGKGVDLNAALDSLGKRGILQLMVEGGAELHGSFLRSGLVDCLTLYIGACALGSGGMPLFGGGGPQSIEDASRWKLLNVQRLGDDVRMDYIPRGEE